jgi:Ca2+-binding EF-hand superfamily protein
MIYNYSIIFFFSTSLILSSCATERAITDFDQWDGDRNRTINQNEFISSYSASGFFRKWTNADAMNYQELYDKLFEGIDSNHDHFISKNELHERSRKTYLNTTDTVFIDYDRNFDQNINYDEFVNHLNSNQIALLWDTSSDKRIDERELAERMFSYCDLNSNRRVEELEFYIWEVNR